MQTELPSKFQGSVPPPTAEGFGVEGAGPCRPFCLSREHNQGVAVVEFSVLGGACGFGLFRRSGFRTYPEPKSAPPFNGLYVHATILPVRLAGCLGFGCL